MNSARYCRDVCVTHRQDGESKRGGRPIQSEPIQSKISFFFFVCPGTGARIAPLQRPVPPLSGHTQTDISATRQWPLYLWRGRDNNIFSRWQTKIAFINSKPIKLLSAHACLAKMQIKIYITTAFDVPISQNKKWGKMKKIGAFPSFETDDWESIIHE